MLRAVARGLLKAEVVTPGGHRRFLLEDFEEFARQARSRPEGVDLVSSREAARLLGVSQPTLNRAVRAGRLHAAGVTPGGHRRFATSELAETRRAAAPGARRPASSWTRLLQPTTPPHK